MFSTIKSTTASLAVEALCRLVLRDIEKNRGTRAYEISRRVFGSDRINSPDHKHMLTWSAISELQKRGKLIRINPINIDACTEEQVCELDAINVGAYVEPQYLTQFMESLPKQPFSLFYPST